MAPNTVWTQMLFYSFDEGATWTNFTFSSFPVQIINVFTPDTSGFFFLKKIKIKNK